MITPRVVAVWLALVLFLAPLPYGSVTPWAVMTLRLVLAAMGLALLWLRPGWPSPRSASWTAAGLLGLAILGWVQSLEWPLALLRLVSPAHAALRDGLRPEVIDFGQDGMALSLAPDASTSVALTLLALAIVPLAGAVAGRSLRGRVILLVGLSSSVVFQFLYGLRNWLAGSSEIWGRPAQMPGGVRLRGTFVNPDHAALLFEIGFAASVAWAWWSARRARDDSRLERRLLLIVPPLAVGLSAGLGVVLTGSRAALLAVAAGTAVQVLAMLGRRRWRWVPLVAVGAVALAAAALWIGGESAFGRLLGTTPRDLLDNPRFRIWGVAVLLWRRFPWLGCGLGSWAEAVSQVPLTAGGDATWTRAHNDYLELLATGGLVGVLLLGLAAVPLLRRVAAHLQSSRATIERASALAAVGVAASVAVHELFDFALTLPANAIVLLTVLSVAAVSPVRERQSAGPRRVAGGGP